MKETLDKSLFKGKDLGLVTQVVEYLRAHQDLVIEIRGSVKKGAEKYSPRSYNDIDIVVLAASDPREREQVILQLAKAYDSIQLIRETIQQRASPPQILEEMITKYNSSLPCEEIPFARGFVSYSQAGRRYVDTFIDNEFIIATDIPKTTVHLTFESLSEREFYEKHK